MGKIGHIFGRSPAIIECPKGRMVDSTRVGIEIELENTSYIPELVYWEQKGDGSLRNGTEFVFREPLGGEYVESALAELHSALRTSGASSGWRTSVHVHVDVRDLTVEQLKRFIALYMIFEKPLYRFAGLQRESNIYCMSYHESPVSIARLADCFSSLGGMEVWRVAEQSKYSGINVKALNTFGSVEFRMHEGEWQKTKLWKWVNILLCLRKAAIERDVDVESIIHSYSREGVNFMRSVFGVFMRCLEYDKGMMDKELRSGARNAEYFLNCKKEYDKEGTRVRRKADSLLAKMGKS